MVQALILSSSVTAVKEIFSSELNKRRPDCYLVNLSGVSKKIPNLKVVSRGFLELFYTYVKNF